MSNYKKGITIIEVLAVIFILSVLVAITAPQLSNFRSNQTLKDTTGNIISALHQAQSQTLASMNASEYGVHFQSDRFIIFTGEVFSSGVASNQTIILTTPAGISNVTLNGVSAVSGDLYFTRLSGAPSKTGTIIVYTPSLSKIITISASGSISSN